MKKRSYVKISSRDKSKVIYLAYRILRRHHEPKEFNGVFFIEAFSDNTDLDVPRYLITDDVNLIYIRDEYNYARATNYVYIDGFLAKNESFAGYNLLQRERYLTKRENALIKLEKIFKKEVFNEFNRIKGSELYYSIIDRLNQGLENRPSGGINDIRSIYSNEFQNLHKFFQSGKDLSFESFINLFE